jgi:MFS family permease
MDSNKNRNRFYLVAEIFFAAIMGAAGAFNAAFAIRLDATNSQIGLLTSLPALLALIISIPAGRYLQTLTRRKSILLTALTVSRVGMLLTALVPFLPGGSSKGLIVVAILIVMSTPTSFFNVGFIPLLADVIPEENRAAIFASRNIIAAGTTSIFVFLFGQLLDRIAFPVNYQVMFSIGWALSMFSLFFLTKVQVPDSTPVVRPPKTRISLSEQVTSLFQTIIDQPSFMRITRNTIFSSIGLWIASPLYILFFVRSLDASDAWIGIQSMVANLSAIVGYAAFRWIMNRWGESITLKTTRLTLGLYPLLIGMFPNLTVILGISFINSFFSSGVNLSQLNQLIKTMPAEKMPEYTAFYYTIVNLGAFLFPMLGVVIANIFGFVPTLIGCGLISFLGAFSFWWSPVNVSEKTTGLPA